MEQFQVREKEVVATIPLSDLTAEEKKRLDNFMQALTDQTRRPKMHWDSRSGELSADNISMKEGIYNTESLHDEIISLLSSYSIDTSHFLRVKDIDNAKKMNLKITKQQQGFFTRFRLLFSRQTTSSKERCVLENDDIHRVLTRRRQEKESLALEWINTKVHDPSSAIAMISEQYRDRVDSTNEE